MNSFTGVATAAPASNNRDWISASLMITKHQSIISMIDLKNKNGLSVWKIKYISCNPFLEYSLCSLAIPNNGKLSKSKRLSF